MRGLRAVDIRIEKFTRNGSLEARLVTGRRLRQSNLVFLIHGWNIHSGPAADEYDRLLDRLERRSPPVMDTIFTVTWPSQRSYSAAVALAPQAGKAFASFLTEERLIATARSILLVGHSLGCRLILEALSALRDKREGEAKHTSLVVALMAAAVPVALVETSGFLFAPAMFADFARVYYSPSDAVLGAPFRVAETKAGEGIMPEAVGLRGKPVQGTWDIRRHMIGYAHGSYWSRDEMLDELANLVAPELGQLATTQIPNRDSDRRLLPSRVLPARP